MKEYKIDASGKKIGRLSSEIAKILMGKNITEFAKNKIPNVKVSVINASKTEITAKKKSDTFFTRYSGYPGGLKEASLSQVIDKKGVKEVIRKSVLGMLPKNSLQSKMIKNLTISE